jgi:cytochrome c peroxidase
MIRFRNVAAVAVLAFAAAVITALVTTRPVEGQAAGFRPPRGLENMPIPVPPDNPMTPGKIALGEKLFFDTRLSRTKKMSCETCHVPEKGWTDGLALSPRFDGSVNTRHSPTLYGAAYYADLYWDGRAKGLEAQILAAWRGQMGADPDAIAKELEAIPAYKSAFEAELGGPPTSDRILKALATFVRTIHAGDTAYDRMSAADLARNEVGQGFKVFSDVAKCTLCHLPPLFSDTLFHNVGIGMDKEKPDQGRGQILRDTAQKANQPVTKEMELQMGAFKTPSLRGVALTGPYFHDGSVKTLEEAVDLMIKGGIPNPNRDEKLQPQTLTAAQRRQLLAFLNSLTPTDVKRARPTLP